MKYRNELKYLISDNEVEVLDRQLGTFMHIDENAKNGRYTISSLYFDDLFDENYYDVDDGVDLKKKYRIRIYDHSSGFIRLEAKQKKNALAYKKSCPLTLKEAEILMSGKDLRQIASRDPVISELLYKIQSQLYRPCIIVEYERIPYVYDAGNVRITLDTNISSSTDTEFFFLFFRFRRPILAQGMQLLEVKYDEFLPGFIYDFLNDMRLEQISFSKYYLCRKYNVMGGSIL